MLKKADKNANRLQRHKRVRRKITGTTQRPRLCVFRSSNNIYAQIIDDANRVTLTAASSLDAEVKGAVNHGGNKEAPYQHLRAGGVQARRPALQRGAQCVQGCGQQHGHRGIEAIQPAQFREAGQVRDP